MTYLNDEPDFDEDGADTVCEFCGELLDDDGACPECDYDDEDDDDLDYESDDISIEALIDMEDHLDE